MKEIRIHGRGGQGVVMASRILALAASYEGKYVQSYPYFGAERRGAPVVSGVRIDDMPIRIRASVVHPNCVVVMDLSLIKKVNVTGGLQADGVVVLNSKREPMELMSTKFFKLAMVDATSIALESLGVPIPNTAMLGAFSAATGWVKIDSICEAITNRFERNDAEKNIKAAKLAYQKTKILS